VERRPLNGCSSSNSWLTLTVAGSCLKVKVVGQSSRSQEEKRR